MAVCMFLLLSESGGLSTDDVGCLSNGRGMSLREPGRHGGCWDSSEGQAVLLREGLAGGLLPRAPSLPARFCLLGRELQADREANRRWPPPVQRPHELPA